MVRRPKQHTPELRKIPALSFTDISRNKPRITIINCNYQIIRTRTDDQGSQITFTVIAELIFTDIRIKIRCKNPEFHKIANLCVMNFNIKMNTHGQGSQITFIEIAERSVTNVRRNSLKKRTFVKNNNFGDICSHGHGSQMTI